MDPSALADTGILIAVPLTLAEFRKRVQDSDWLGKFRPPGAGAEELQAATDVRWRDVYSPLVAEPLQEVVEIRTGRMGAEVRAAAQLADLAAVTGAKKTAILFAHWKGPEIVFDDLIPPWNFDALANRAAESRGPMGKWVDAALGKRRSKLDSDAVLDVLNEALDAPLGGSADGVASILEHAVTRQARRREELQALFPDLLRAGNRLEMFDGLHSKEEVEASVALDFAGILDLTACTSTVLGDYLAARRRNRLRTVQFPEVVEFIWAAKAVAGALRFAASGGFDYLEARDLTTRMLTQAIQELAR